MNFLDLFSGIGGFALGAYWAGLRFDRHYFSEVDPYATKVYRQRFPEAVPLGDIRKIRGADLPRGEWIIAGGFPCQDISTAGKGAGLAGSRSGLWYEYNRIIEEIKPRFAIMENVGRLASKGLDEVLRCLAALGYDAEWQDIRASDVGAPHRRERIWIVAYPNTVREPGSSESREQLERPAQSKGSCTVRMETGPDVADSDRTRRPRQRIGGGNEAQESRAGSAGASLCDTASKGLSDRPTEPMGRSEQDAQPQRSDWWATEPDVGRVAHGVPAFLDGGMSDEQMATEEGRAEGSPNNGQVRKVRKDGEPSAASSRLQQAERGKNTLPGLSCDSGLGGRDEAQKADAEMRSMREDVRPAGLPQTQDLRIDLSSDPGTRKRIKAVAWENEPDIGRVATGVKNRVDRLKCLGNSIVPQIAELIFAQIKVSP